MKPMWTFDELFTALVPKSSERITFLGTLANRQRYCTRGNKQILVLRGAGYGKSAMMWLLREAFKSSVYVHAPDWIEIGNVTVCTKRILKQMANVNSVFHIHFEKSSWFVDKGKNLPVAVSYRNVRELCQILEQLE